MVNRLLRQREEKGGKNLSGVKFSYYFYKSSGALYSTESLDIGDGASGGIVRKKVYLQGKYQGEETLSEKQIYINRYISTDITKLMECRKNGNNNLKKLSQEDNIF